MEALNRWEDKMVQIIGDHYRSLEAELCKLFLNPAATVAPLCVFNYNNAPPQSSLPSNKTHEYYRRTGNNRYAPMDEPGLASIKPDMAAIQTSSCHQKDDASLVTKRPSSTLDFQWGGHGAAETRTCDVQPPIPQQPMRADYEKQTEVFSALTGVTALIREVPTADTERQRRTYSVIAIPGLLPPIHLTATVNGAERKMSGELTTVLGCCNEGPPHSALLIRGRSRQADRHGVG